MDLPATVLTALDEHAPALLVRTGNLTFYAHATTDCPDLPYRGGPGQTVPQVVSALAADDVVDLSPCGACQPDIGDWAPLLYAAADVASHLPALIGHRSAQSRLDARKSLSGHRWAEGHRVSETAPLVRPTSAPVTQRWAQDAWTHLGEHVQVRLEAADPDLAAPRTHLLLLDPSALAFPSQALRPSGRPDPAALVDAVGDLAGRIPWAGTGLRSHHRLTVFALTEARARSHAQALRGLVLPADAIDAATWTVLAHLLATPAPVPLADLAGPHAAWDRLAGDLPHLIATAHDATH